jgi:hypothetical protein
MQGLPLSGSFAINLAGAALALLIPAPLETRHGPSADKAFGRPMPRDIWPHGGAIEVPQLFVAADLRRSGDRPDEHRGCPADRPVDRGAAPEFPLFGPERPFPWLGESGANPEICARIGARGRVAAAYVLRTGGDDRALLRQVYRLRFSPARRDGRRVAAWHRLIVNRRDGAQSLPIEWFEEAPEPVPPPPPPPRVQVPINPTIDVVYTP